MTDNQLSFLDPTARARRSDPETSHAASASVQRIRESQMLILSVLRARGEHTDEQIFAVLTENNFFGQKPLSVSGARTRRKELVDLGYVEDSGARMKTKSNRQTIVWRAKHSAIQLQEGT